MDRIFRVLVRSRLYALLLRHAYGVAMSPFRVGIVEAVPHHAVDVMIGTNNTIDGLGR